MIGLDSASEVLENEYIPWFQARALFDAVMEDKHKKYCLAPNYSVLKI